MIMSGLIFFVSSLLFYLLYPEFIFLWKQQQRKQNCLEKKKLEEVWGDFL